MTFTHQQCKPNFPICQVISSTQKKNDLFLILIEVGEIFLLYNKWIFYWPNSQSALIWNFFLISIGVTLSMFILTQWPPHSIYVILFSWKVKLKVKMSGYKSRSLAAVHKTHKKKKRKENRPISSHLDLKVVNNAYGIWMRMS